MKINEFVRFGLLAGMVSVMAGCAEHQTGEVRVYQPPPVYQPQTVYVYPAQTNSTSPPPVTQSPMTAQPAQPGVASAQPAPVPPPPPPPPPSGQVVVNQPPPALPVEVAPVAPGPGYVWAPGYWTWNGSWVWVGGGWVLRPRPYAVWVGPHWVRHGHGYVWVRGYWR